MSFAEAYELWERRGDVSACTEASLTSQFFANVYLDALDHFIKDQLRVKRYVRYVDDFCCFDDDKHLLTDLRAAIVEFLFGLRLRLNAGKSRLRQVREGVEFLGFVVFPDQLRLNQTAVRRQRRRIKNLQREYAEGSLDWPDVRDSLQAWNAHTEHGTTWRLRNDVFGKAAFVKSRRPVAKSDESEQERDGGEKSR